MLIALIILAVAVVLLGLWSAWLLWDRGKKIQAISERRSEIRGLRRERDVWMKAADVWMKAAKGEDDADRFA